MSFTVFYLIFCTIAFIYRLRLKKKTRALHVKHGKIYGKWTLKAMYGGLFLVILGAPIEYFICKRDINLTIAGMGLALWLSSLFARKWPLKELGEYVSPHAEIREGQTLIKQGPYRYMRHPYYLCLILEGIGFVLISNAYYTLWFTILYGIPIIFVRIHYEEKALIDEFGQDYLDYKKEVYAFLPLKKVKE
ncbi:isoprenylcysteine carboxylmethyltransferase family protein [bacterium]|nr:isoprenylcysteine carboxylmethyltransferase family protein [bacterium]MBU1615868.1 isoprenylcysteine carboxylmethyltransferase family protein [bacterium]